MFAASKQRLQCLNGSIPSIDYARVVLDVIAGDILFKGSLDVLLSVEHIGKVVHCQLDGFEARITPCAWWAIEYGDIACINAINLNDA